MFETRQAIDQMLDQDHVAAVHWARRLLENLNSWMIIDTETTGLANNDLVISVSLIDPCGGIALNTLVACEKPSHPKALAKHGITTAQLVGAPSWQQVHRELLALAAGRDLVSYNAAFDWRLLIQTCLHHQINPDQLAQAQWHCAMHWYAQWWGNWNDYQQSYTWQKLPNSSHAAAADALATLALIKEMAKE